MRKLAIAVALSSTVLATPALARDGAWYIGGDLGPMIVEDLEFDVGTNQGGGTRGGTGGGTGGGTQNAFSIDHEYGYDGDVVVGLDFGAFRVEGEVSYKRARVDSIERDPGFGTRFPGQGARDTGQFLEAGGNTSALSFMVNGMLDFGEDEGISGFVGGGAGVARVKFNNIGIFENRAPILDDSDTRFA